MKIAALVEALVATGATPETILAAVRVAEEQKDAAIDASREKARARVAKWRDKQAGNVTERLVTSRNGLRGSATRVEDKTSTQQIEPQEQEERKKDPPGGDLVAFRAALSPFLDTERLDAIVKHRKNRKAPISGHAAGLFITAAGKAGLSLPDAVDACIERGWLTVKADWLAPRGRAGPRLVAPQLADVFAMAGRGYADDRERREGSSRAQQAVPHLRPAGTGTD